MVVASVVAWIAIGIVIAFWMVRRGHAPAIWFALCFYGPLLLLLAMTATDTERESTPVVLDEGRPGSGPLRVLVGIDGSEESRAALDEVVDLLGTNIGQLTLACVLDHDEAQLPGHTGHRDQAEAWLRDEASRIELAAGLVPATVLLVGRPATSLSDHAREGGYHLIAVGSRGHGATRLIMGSVATHLSGGAGIPVLVVPTEHTTPPATRADA